MIIILFVHAWSGFDTISSIFCIGKTTVLKKNQNSTYLRELSSNFRNQNAKSNEIAEAGRSVLVSCYGGKAGQSLDRLCMTSI